MGKDIFALVDKYNKALPRYTSYPTAPQFSSSFSGEDYRKWLSEVGNQEGLSLYFHIPYCEKLCWFCGCHTKITTRYQPIQSYLEQLITEIKLVTENLPRKMSVAHIHFGGGSPNILQKKDFAYLMSSIKKSFSFSEAIEIAVEIDPRTTSLEFIQSMAQSGVNRVSMGVQDFSSKVQEAINRVQPYDLTKNVIDMLRQNGIDRINVDLMYGLPHQTVESIVESVDLAMRLEPNRVTLFGYAHVPWMKKHQRLIPDSSLPGPHFRWELSTAASQRLAHHGYQPLGIDHFVQTDDDMYLALKEKRLHRNFQGYTTDTAPTLLGFGSSAIGQLPQGYAQNTANWKEYQAAIESGTLPVAKGIAVVKDDIVRREVINQLMCYLEVDIPTICRKFAVAPEYFSYELSLLDEMIHDGIITLKEGRVIISPEMRSFVRAVCSKFDGYLTVKKNRHAQLI